ncbi:MAG: alpha/beta hydrolase [Proteobacteria bacterium]|nr:alpha/beta hydrolase [Pseudomonadota bacterium]
MVNEITLNVRGLKIAAKTWNAKSGTPTLALHGWLDNAASFDNLAPLLPDCHIVAIDLPGHGFSDHLAKSSTLHMLDIAIFTILIAKELGWDNYALLGHSLGAGIVNFVAGTIPQSIKWVVAIDALAPLTKAADFAPVQFRRYIEELIAKPNKQSPRYASFDDALQARLKANHMKEASAKILVKRGLQELETGEWTWRTDPRLLMPLAQLLTEEQVLAYLREITAPVCYIKAQAGYPFLPEITLNRFNAIKQIMLYELPGQHHLHLDAAESVATAIHSFLKNEAIQK